VERLADRLLSVRRRLDEAARAHGRDPSAVRLIAVSKEKPAEAIREAYAAGQRDFGENYVQEMVRKRAALEELTGLRFHLIGHLQRNKAKLALTTAVAVHSVDSIRLARELGRRAAESPIVPERAFPIGGQTDHRLVVLVEVNIAAEAQKSGCPAGELGGVLDAVDSAPSLRLAGLMTVPPYTDDPRDSLPHFEALAELRERHGGARRLPELSMGMSHDFEHAMAAGATIVRIGQLIFGPRG
jgi:pyridoxal phosphate enzyme (YggS family)